MGHILTVYDEDGNEIPIPAIQGRDGATPNLKIGTVETLGAGSKATASITGTAENPLLNLGIPSENTYKKIAEYELTEATTQIEAKFPESIKRAVAAIVVVPAGTADATYAYVDWKYDGDEYYWTFSTFASFPRTTSAKSSISIALLGDDLGEFCMATNTGYTSESAVTAFNRAGATTPAKQLFKARNYFSDNTNPINGIQAFRLRAESADNPFPVGTKLILWGVNA